MDSVHFGLIQHKRWVAPVKSYLSTPQRFYSQGARNMEATSFSLSLFCHLSKAYKDALRAIIFWVRSYTTRTNKYLGFLITFDLTTPYSPRTLRWESHMKLSGLSIMTKEHTLPSLLHSICVQPKTADWDSLSSLISSTDFPVRNSQWSPNLCTKLFVDPDSPHLTLQKKKSVKVVAVSH